MRARKRKLDTTKVRTAGGAASRRSAVLHALTVTAIDATGSVPSPEAKVAADFPVNGASSLGHDMNEKKGVTVTK